LEKIIKDNDDNFLNSLIEILPKHLLSEYVYTEASGVKELNI
jgi:hypothetical protein